MKKIFLALTSGVLFFAACDKKVTLPTNNNNATAAATPTPAPASGDGFLVAIYTVNNTVVAGIPVNTTFGTGVAGFGNLASGTYNDAGTVSLAGKVFTKNANNTYVYTTSVNDITGIDMSGTLQWNVAGGNGTPAFTHDATAQGLPTSGDLSSFTSINSDNDFTLSTVSGVNNADSVYFQISGANGTVLKRMGPNTSAATFTSAELKTLGKGTGTVVIAPWNLNTTTISGKMIHVINETALTRVVDIQ